MTKTIRSIISIGVIALVGIMNVKVTLATDGDGNGSGGVTVNCSAPTTAYQLLCGNPSGSDGGGASWHVYSTAYYSGPTFIANYLPLDNGTINVEDIKVTCPASQYKTYVAYGWEGMNSRLGQHIGPANHGQGTIGGAHYNSYNAISDLATLQTLIANGGDNIKITADLAQTFHGGSIASDVGYFCIPDEYIDPNKTITLYAIDDNGSRTWGTAHDKSSTVQKGNSASVTADSIYGYSKQYWGSSTASNTWWYNTGMTYSVTSLNDDTTIYAVYTKDTFEGKANVSGQDGATDTTNWQSTDNTVTAEMECANEGCTADFELYLRRTAGLGSTSYSIQRKKNTGSWTYKQTSTTVNPGASLLVGSYSETLFPGDTVCYKVNFYTAPATSSTASETACIYAKPSYFQGKSDVYKNSAASGTIRKTTNWQNSNTSVIYAISNCDEGCTVSFAHNMKRTEGIGSSDWIITRTSNLASGSRDISNATVGSGTFTPSTNNTSVTVGTDTNLTLYPGMVVCERLSFQPVNTSTSKVYTEICVHANGDAQPGNDAFLDIEVKNNDVTKYGTYTHEVYAKPGDSLTYRASYNPTLQYTYYLVPQQMQIDGGTIYENSSSRTLGSFFNNKSSGYWKNAFSVQQTKNNFSSTSLIANHTFTAGSTTKQEKTNNATVNFSDVGKSIDEDAITNLNSNTKITPSEVTFSEQNNKNTANVITTQVEAIARARIPYNFINTTEITTPEDTLVYAGEKRTIDFDIHTNVKQNNETDGTYATEVHDAKWRLNVSYTDETGYHDLGYLEGTGNLNSNNTMDGSTASKYFNITIPDISAGSKLCVGSSVYPANSGADKNWSDKEGSHTWATSGTSTCYTVAKRPHLEVLGGNIFSNKNISTSTSVKYHVNGTTAYSLNNNTYTSATVFGSWGELGIISNGVVSGMASGARLGHNLGSTESSISFCNRVALTFANFPSCSTAGLLGKYSSSSDSGLDRNLIADKYLFRTNTISGTDVASFLSDPGASGEVYKNDNIYYYHNGNESLNIKGSGNIYVPINTTQVVHGKNVTIENNLYYATGAYSNFSTMPKLVVYADDEIYIRCGVNHIDGVLVAKRITTCSDGQTDAIISDPLNSNQLTINGAVIASELIANRTYGATKGSGSIISAEIINFDPSLYRWSTTSRNVNTSGNTATTDLTTTYQKELAPRY